MKINTLENNKSPPLIALGTAFILFLFVIQGAKAVTYISSCSVLDQEGETYYVTNHININSSPCINITANNIVLDCQYYGFWESGEYVIYAEGVNNITIQNCYIHPYSNNIYLKNSNYSVVRNITGTPITLHNSNFNVFENIITREYTYGAIGIHIVDSSFNNISNSNVYGWYYGIKFSGYCTNNTIKNLISRNSIWVEGNSNTIENVIGYGMLRDIGNRNVFKNITVYGGRLETNNFDNLIDAVIYTDIVSIASNNTLKNIIVFSNYVGIGNSNNITNMNVTSSNGITILSSNILNNVFVNGSSNIGINVTGSSNILDNVMVVNSVYGIYLDNDYNTIKNSIIKDNQYGIWINRGQFNLIYNNLFNNTNNVYFNNSNVNYWNTTKQFGKRIYGRGLEIGGNYWTNPEGNGYSDTCSNEDKDGFCDEPYVLLEDPPNIDYLPLTMPPPPLPPQITLNIPENNSKLYTQDISFSFIAIDDSANILECSIYLDGLLNETNSSVLNNTLTNFLIKGISYGEHSWFINCSDSEVSNTSEVRYFIITIPRLSDLGLGGIMGALIIIVMFSLVPFFVLRDYLLNPEISFSGMIKILLAIVVVIAFIIVFAGITGWL
ncbi:MAG: NosD domain-containing protein [Candidatus Aenigmatarchaeota archaeon]